MTATLNGIPRSFDRFKSTATGLVGYGFDGSVEISLPSLAPGTYACPSAAFIYDDSTAGGRDSDRAGTVDCCTIQILRSGAIGEPIEGTFSGILDLRALQSWINLEDGHFIVIRQSPDGGT